MRLIILLLALSSTTVKANNILSCEARAGTGNYENLDFGSYEKIYPTIIFSEGSNSVSFVYSQHGTQWKTVYEIDRQNEDSLVGISRFGVTTVDIFHYDKRTKIFNAIWSGGDYEFGNTFTVGKCFD